MKEPSLWTLFSDTGDPLAYLLYRRRVCRTLIFFRRRGLRT